MSPLVQTLITGLFAGLAGLGGYFVQDYLTSRKERKKEQLDKLEHFRIYADPLNSALESLFFRLQDIFDSKAKFLLELAPKNEFYQYRYISSLYRLCLVLGWLNLDKAIDGLRDAMATPPHNIEQERLAYLAKKQKWNIKIDGLSDELMDELEEDVRNRIWDSLSASDKNYAFDLAEEEQLELLKNIADAMCRKTGQELVDSEVIRSHKGTCIRAISRTESWIYRDWQLVISCWRKVSRNHLARNRIL
ncbi:MAG: hypothetical protein OEQ53_19175 [Saprospiraceae bacterium]|nr:hypothetical protein [Saprospiraceae bacterium]